MPVLTKTLKLILKMVKNPLKRLKIIIKQRLGWLGIPKILAFRGFGNSQYIYIKGMVIEDKGLSQPTDKQSIMSNILAMFKRYVSDQIPGVRLKINFYSSQAIITTNEHGIFELKLDISELSLTERNWHSYKVELLDKIMQNQPLTTARGEVLITHVEGELGIISDVDDTFLVSHATKALKKLRLMLMKNARTRMPFPGVAEFYQALHRTANPKWFNPIFYVSSSEWNLYDMLEDFAQFHNIPKGPFLLREMQVSIFKFWKSGSGNHDHKLEKIRRILSTISDLQFILIGDSGQHDTAIYTQIANEFPNRIKAIYIRNVSSAKRIEKLKFTTQQLDAKNVEVVFVNDTFVAADHAFENGYITPNAHKKMHQQASQQ